MNPQHIEIVVVYPAPIPVGHRVEVRYYRVEGRGLLGRTALERAHEPVLFDCDTGVEYATDHAYEGAGSKRPDLPVELASAPAGPPSAVLRGIVRGCRVVCVRRFAGFDLQTHLLLERTG